MNRHSRRGVAVDPEQIWFRDKPPGATRDYTLDIGWAIHPVTDVIAGATVAAAPSGDGELAISSLTITGTELTVRLTGGQPTRRYRLLFQATLTNGEVRPFEVLLDVPPVFPTDAAPPAPVAGFSAPIAAAAAVPLVLSLARPMSAGLAATLF